MPFDILEDPTGKPVTAKANISGALKVDVTAMSGGGDASAVNQTNGTQKTQVTDGTNSASVTNSAPTTEYGVVTRNIPSGTQPVSATSLPLPDGAATQTTLAAIATNTPAPLGTGFARIRGTVSTTSTAFPSQLFPRGFLIRNLESVKTIYVAAGTVTTADGWPILPGETHEFDLPNSNILQGITSAATSAYAIGAVT